jgi:hypothetical protein
LLFLRPPPKEGVRQKKKLSKKLHPIFLRARKKTKSSPPRNNIRERERERERERYKRKHAHHLHQFVSNTIAFCRDEDDDDDESEEFARVLDFFSFFFFEELEIAPVLDEEESIAEKAL